MKLFRFSLFAPALGFLAVMTLGPFVFVLGASVLQVQLGAPLKFVGLAHYGRLLADPYFWLALRNTLALTGCAVALELACGAGLALLFRPPRGSAPLPGAAAMRFVILIPMMLSPLLVGLFWKYMLDQVFGVVTWLCAQAGAGRPSFLTSPGLAFVSILVVDAWQWTPFVFLLCLAGLQSLPAEQEEAAVLERASSWMRVRLLLLPHLKPALLLAGLFRGIDTMKIFDLVYILTGGGPGDATITLSVLAYRLGFSYFDIGRASALAILLLLIVNALATVAVRRMSAPARRTA
ncbi:MAG: sugar ABC transporter permease [bacterium]